MSLPLRSLLFAPGDDEHKLRKALGAGADGVVFDLEDAVAIPAKAQARAVTRAFLSETRGASARLVRVNAHGSAWFEDDVETFIQARLADYHDWRRPHTDHTIVGLELADHAVPLFQLSVGPDVCIAIGHEEHGLTVGTLAACDAVAFIPQLGRVGSLNVATAAAIAIYELRRRDWTGAS